ncbi:MAG: hypothetical protein ACE5HU_04290, partial [Acidobacteriota bacterium]
ARVKLLSSAFGDRLDHTVDISFEFSWYIGLGWGLSRSIGTWFPLKLAVILIAIMLSARGVSGLYRFLTGHQIHDHRAFDRAFRLVAGRRNIHMYVLLLGSAAGHLLAFFQAVVIWAAVTLGVYGLRTLVVFTQRAIRYRFATDD